jgi:hypothetical protein
MLRVNYAKNIFQNEDGKLLNNKEDFDAWQSKTLNLYNQLNNKRIYFSGFFRK